MKNIVLISIDNLRFDCVGYQPDKKELIKYDVLKHLETPTLDRIAEKSLCFTQCISTNTYTTAAHASIFTGLYPPGHGVRGFYDKKLSGDVYTLAEILKIFGYETAMMTDTSMLFQPLEMHRGFDHFFHIDERELLKFLGEKRDRKLFVFAHFYDVHDPFLLSKNPEFRRREYLDAMDELCRKFKVDLKISGRENVKQCHRLWRRLVDRIGYKGHGTFFPLYVRGVTRFDQGRFGNFIGGIDSLGLRKDSLLVIVSDHGEGKSLPENPDNFTHGGKLYDSVIRVPLMIYDQEYSHRMIDDNVSIVDIFPTILNLAVGQKADSLLPYKPHGICLDSLSGEDDRFVYSENWSRDTGDTSVPDLYPSFCLDQRSLRSSADKFVIHGEPECLETSEAVRVKSDGLFIQDVYRGLLCRFEGFWEYRKILRDLEEGEITREGFLDKTVHSLEYRSKDRYVKFDLRKDPYEENPVNMAVNSGYPGDSKKYFDEIKLISRCPARSENIFPGENDTVVAIAKKAFEHGWEEKADILAGNKHLLTCLIADFLMAHKIDPILDKKKSAGHSFLTSPDFVSFLRMRMSRGISKSFFIKKAVTEHIPYYKLNKLYFLLLRLFPRKTRRGQVWYRFLSKIRHS